jgi:acetyl/propionyl-CoA carboxylase alpha subunit
MGIRTVAVYSDADANALHVRSADAAVHIGPSAARESYLQGERIIAAAKASGAEAIHPGYGFLSENAEFAQAVIDAGLIWVGPKPSSITAMGLKDAAKERMIAAGVPVTPGYLGADQSGERLQREADAIGYPVLIKAVAGGGGKGMRRVDAAADFADALGSCQREAAASFGDDRVLIEKYILSPRHIEVQVFGDSHGNVVHLFERDCSLQRRHQKVIEEAPAPGMDAATRASVCAAAVAAARAVDYVGAGTIEFIADASEGLKPDRIWFMEMNTRLQVEHPVTEEITGQDLVEWQLRVASGEPLPKRQDQLSINGWAMEARLYAEDPARGFLPSTGTLDVFHLEAATSGRIDTGVTQGAEISPFYDPMIAKVIAHGTTREEARVRLVLALAETVVLGPTTNRHFLIRLLEHPDFAAGEATTSFLVKHQFPTPEIGDAHWTAAANLLWQASAQKYAPSMRGWRNSNPEPTPIRLAAGGTERLIHVNATDPVDVPFHIDGNDIVVDFDALTVRFTDKTYAPPETAAAGSDGKLRAPMDGRIVSIKVAAGDRVSRGQTLIVLEAMKIQHQLKAALDAKIEAIPVQEGQQVSNRTVLVTMEPAAT